MPKLQRAYNPNQEVELERLIFSKEGGNENGFAR
jgi:hypothetical protein